MINFETLLGEILEVDAVDLNDELTSFECWDSLTILSIIALVDQHYRVSLTAKEIIDSRTVEGLKLLVTGKIK
jgi:acyl carrier protein